MPFPAEPSPSPLFTSALICDFALSPSRWSQVSSEWGRHCRHLIKWRSSNEIFLHSCGPVSCSICFARDSALVHWIVGSDPHVSGKALTRLWNSGSFLLRHLCVWECASVCHSTCEFRGQLTGIGSLFLPRGPQRSDSGVSLAGKHFYPTESCHQPLCGDFQFPVLCCLTLQMMNLLSVQFLVCG